MLMSTKLIVKKFAFIINDCFVSEGQRLSSSWNFL